mmetsp:Transcript_9638/g.16017  ORF Transcript_9638/g.16017 Transcript_9638/m.16017 type:complete len:86 (+) Transcript_9638:738-995(+)
MKFKLTRAFGFRRLQRYRIAYTRVLVNNGYNTNGNEYRSGSTIGPYLLMMGNEMRIVTMQKRNANAASALRPPPDMNGCISYPLP